MLYVKLSKALYGMLRAALLFYKRLRKDLENMGFEVNPYDPCVANMMVNRAQSLCAGIRMTYQYSTWTKPL